VDVRRLRERPWTVAEALRSEAVAGNVKLVKKLFVSGEFCVTGIWYSPTNRQKWGDPRTFDIINLVIHNSQATQLASKGLIIAVAT